MEYYVGSPNIANKEQFDLFVKDILSSGQLTNNGKYVNLLEDYIKNFTGAKDAIAVCNATQGLELLLSTLPKQSYVVTPAFTFIATTTAILRAGLIPLFVDVTDKFKMDLDHLERILNDYSKMGYGVSAILPVNLYGGIDLNSKMKKLALEHGAKIFYDSAHSLGSVNDCFGDAEVYSLHATKLVNGFEGGVIVTKDLELATRLRQLRNFNYIGSTIEDTEGDFVRFSDMGLYEASYSYGTNAKLSEVHAAMALSNIYKLDYLIANNRCNYYDYINLINNTVGEYIVQDLGSVTNYSYLVCRHPDRDYIVSELKKKGIHARKYFYHLTCDQFGYKPLLPTSRKLVQEVFCLPTGLNIKHPEVEFIANAVTSALEQRKNMLI